MSEVDGSGRFTEVEGLRLHYREAGSGEPLLLLHGWPTSSYLWRNLLPTLAEGNRVLALDLPGFGRSDKPLDVSYSFRFYDRAIGGFLDAVGADRVGIAVHDVGGPLGMHWAAQNPGRVTGLALLNTLVYARPSLAVIAFVAASRTPGLRSRLVSPRGLRWALRFGVRDKGKLSEEAIAAYQEPFREREARRALLRAGTRLHFGGLRTIERWLPEIEVPVRVVYGERDRILPDVARTMRRVARDVPGEVEVTPLPDCGHFIQEEEPELIARLLAEHFAR